jgi:hypothetical protein
LFTSRNQAAEGLRLQSITKHHVDSISDDAAQRVLLADGVQLDKEQLQEALRFCGGLPLALTLLQGALHAHQAGGSADAILQRIKASGNISCDKSDRLWELLMFSVECLSEELQTAWLDLVQLFAAQPCRSSADHFGIPSWNIYPLQSARDKLYALFGQDVLQELQQRNLVAIRGSRYAEVVVHDVLLRMASHMCEFHSQPYHAQEDRYMRSSGLQFRMVKVRPEPLDNVSA